MNQIPNNNNLNPAIIQNPSLIIDKNLNSDNQIINPLLLPIPFRSDLNFNGDSICTIDLIGFNNGDPTIITPTCNHIFHPKCINE